jgi:Tetratricopeptide repeat
MNRQTLQLKETVLGKYHPITLGSMMDLATLLRQQGKYTEAGAIHQRVDVKSHPQGQPVTTARKKTKESGDTKILSPR